MIRALGRTYRDAFAGLPRDVWLLSIAQFVNRSGTMVLPFLTLWLIEKRGFTTTDAGRALALYGAGAMAGAYGGGVLVDRLGARTVMLASLVLQGAGFLWLGSLETRLCIWLTLPFLSLVGEALRPAASAALAQCAAPGERVRAYALARLAVNLGMSFGPTAGGFLAMWDYVWLFRIDAATSLAATALLWFFFRGVEPRAVRARTAAEEAEPIRSPWRDAPYLVYLALMTLFAIVVFQISSTYTLYLHRDLGHSEAHVGLLLGANTLIIVLVEMVVVHRLRGKSPIALLGPGAFLFCAGFALMPLARGVPWLLFTVLVWTAGEMLALPMVESIVADRADERSRGRYMGLLTVSFALALMLAPLVGTAVYEEHGAATLWYGCGALGVGLWIGFALLRGSLSRTRSATT